MVADIFLLCLCDSRPRNQILQNLRARRGGMASPLVQINGTLFSAWTNTATQPLPLASGYGVLLGMGLVFAAMAIAVRRCWPRNTRWTDRNRRILYGGSKCGLGLDRGRRGLTMVRA